MAQRPGADARLRYLKKMVLQFRNAGRWSRSYLEGAPSRARRLKKMVLRLLTLIHARNGATLDSRTAILDRSNLQEAWWLCAE